MFHSGETGKSSTMMKRTIVNGRHNRKYDEPARRGIVCTYDSRHRILKVPMEDDRSLSSSKNEPTAAYSGEYRNALMTKWLPPRIT